MAARLTSTFRPPASCTNDIYRMTNSDTNVGPYYSLLGGGGYSSCLPSAFSPDQDFYYSPGLYCPAGYTTACTTLAQGGSGETIATCCPSGYRCQTTSRYPWETTLGCTKPCESSFDFTVTDQLGILSRDSCVLGAGFNAYSVQLRFQAADFITTSSVASSTSLLTPPSSSAVTRSTPTSETPANTGTSAPFGESGLSIGAKAGIGVGSVLGVALVAAVFWLAFVLHKKSKNRPEGPVYEQAELTQRPLGSDDPRYPVESHGLSPSPKYTYQAPPQDHYVYANVDAHEVAGHHVRQPRYELPAERQNHG